MVDSGVVVGVFVYSQLEVVFVKGLLLDVVWVERWPRVGNVVKGVIVQGVIPSLPVVICLEKPRFVSKRDLEVGIRQMSGGMVLLRSFFKFSSIF